MGPNSRYRAAVYAGPLVTLLTLGFFSDEPWVFPVLIGEMLLIGGYSMSIRCPRCQRPVGRGQLGFWTPFGSPNCRKCGYDLG